MRCCIDWNVAIIALIILWHTNCCSLGMMKATNTYELIPFNTNIFKVLIAEDQITNQMLLYKWLKKLGFQAIDIVNDGIEALEHIKNTGYDLILMDCLMPGLNGYKTTKIIRDLEKRTNWHLPIIAMTADTTDCNRTKCLQAGMDNCVYKPLQFKVLRKALYTQLYKDQEEPLPFPEITKEKDKNNGNSITPPVDTTRLYEFTDGNKVIEGTLVRAFIEESKESIKIMEKTCTQASSHDWAGAVHSLKGASGNLGANRLYTLCIRAEDPFAQDEVMKSILLREIKNELSAVNDFLKSL